MIIFQADIKTYRFGKNGIYSFKETILSVFNKYNPVTKKMYSREWGTFYDKKVPQRNYAAV